MIAALAGLAAGGLYAELPGVRLRLGNCEECGRLGIARSVERVAHFDCG